MTKDEIFNEIKKTLKEKFNKNITLNTSVKDLGIDSLDLLDLIVGLEEKFNIKIDDNKILNIKTIKDIVEEIENIL